MTKLVTARAVEPIAVEHFKAVCGASQILLIKPVQFLSVKENFLAYSLQRYSVFAVLAEERLNAKTRSGIQSLHDTKTIVVTFRPIGCRYALGTSIKLMILLFGAMICARMLAGMARTVRDDRFWRCPPLLNLISVCATRRGPPSVHFKKRTSFNDC